MKNEPNSGKIHLRPLCDFINPAITEQAGIIEIRNGENNDPVIRGLEYDSRKTEKGFIFFALSGLHMDGHDFIPDAINRGALAIVHEKELAVYRDNIIYIKAKNSRFAMSPIANAFYDHPSRHMGIIGVTGTEGKSTTVYLIYQLLKLMNKKTGFISTVMRGDGSSEIRNTEHQTTPEAVTIHRLLAEMNLNGAEYAVLETSSHGLSKKTNRLGDVDFDVGVMTNVTHEHLEFHGSWEQYRSDKAKLFRSLDESPSSHLKDNPEGNLSGQEDFPVPSFGVVNGDDPSADYFSAATRHKTYTYSTRGAEADLSVILMESGTLNNWYEVLVSATGQTVTIRDQLPGAFNAGNVLASLLTVSNLLSVGIEELVPLVPYLKPVRGRMNAVNCGQPFEVLVDYAHTPSSFETIFPPLRERLNLRGGRLIALFGSAGERDTRKRPLQGEIAARYSDIVILADEDPRGEEPMAILEEIAKGCEASSGCEAASGSVAGTRMIRNETLFLIPDRPLAIRKAFSLAKAGDLVLLLGKGHENSIIYADKAITFDEISEAEAGLKESGYLI